MLKFVPKCVLTLDWVVQKWDGAHTSDPDLSAQGRKASSSSSYYKTVFLFSRRADKIFSDVDTVSNIKNDVQWKM